ncbi:hypothetical protein EC957_002627 [Mortierella hygrophila]|uniref:ubiquitinyl hydrolase 1 n=1 Tax=Mortierella hygrophila TaxID=979708 RepID=A0A9P6K114_9FUNG|nr:hypothetical protein EC957_002627 [Mortierella hygrophila]
MPPITKKDKQWQFIEDEVREVDDLTMDHIRDIYGLGPLRETGENGSSTTTEPTGKKVGGAYPYCGNRYNSNPSGSPMVAKGKTKSTCTAARCKDGNPHCLNYMGQEQWEKEDAFDEYHEAFSSKTDPELSKRKPDCPAGMKNLGATCYANSLLQVWFHDLTFRDAICRSRFRIDADKSSDALYQLQHLFALLDYGTKNTYNPLSLVTSLKLDTNMQQDAQEFCNLFMALIDNHLQSQEDAYLRSFIKDQFQGHYSYITTCKRCKRSSVRDCTFYELMLNIKENHSLMDCFNEFVKAEELVGLDRYSCSFCESLQDATREIKLDILPKVLNIQLMRFVYDATTSTKKKSKDTIRFPLTIDFSKLTGSQTSTLYDLSAVLVHSGPSAHSGHFIAHVLDKRLNKWFVLNDEEVTPFDSTVFDPQDYAETGSESKAKKKTIKAGASDADRLLNTLSSRNAYMLTYTRRTSEPSVTPRKPPFDILDLVMADNADFDNELKDYTELKPGSSLSKLEKIAEKSIAAGMSTMMSCYVSSAALSKYMQLEGGRTSEDGSLRENSTTVDLDSLAVACEHQNLCPTAVSKSKRISMCLLAEQGVRIDPVLTPMDVCLPCSRNLFQDKWYHIMHRQDIDAIKKLTSGKGKLSPAFWISKPWMTTWQKVSPEFHHPHTSTAADPSPLSEPYLHDVFCEHSNLSEDKSRRRAISKKCLKRLTEIFGPMELPKHDDPECQECKKSADPYGFFAAAALEKDELRGMNTHGVPNDIVQGERYYAVSRDFMKRWMGFTKDPVKNERPKILDNSGLLCKHDLFLFDLNNPADKKHNENVVVIREGEWSYFRSIYGGGPDIVIINQESVEGDDSSTHDHVFSTVQSTPAHCPECRILDFSTTTLTVRIYKANEFVINDESSSTPASTDNSQAPTPTNDTPPSDTTTNAKSKRKQVPAHGSTGTRQSKRIRTGKVHYDERSFSEIMELKGTFPLCQKLLYGKVELDDNEKTIAELAIPPGTVLNVLTFDQDVDGLDLDTFHNDTPPSGDAGGFSGTGLSKNWF